MRHFVFRLFIFVAPFIVIIFLLGIASIYIGEALPVEMVVEQQQNGRQILYYPSWQPQDAIYYKYLSTVAHEPEILILGSSRMFEVRSEFFTINPELVYNASTAGFDTNEMLRFVLALGEANKLPEILILNIDPPYFNASESQLSSNRLTQIVPPPYYMFDYVSRGVRRAATEWIVNPSSLLVNLENSRSGDGLITYGIYAMTNAYAFRNDGSLYFGSVERRIADRIQADWRRFNRGSDWFEFGTDINEAAMSDLEMVIQYTQSKGTTLIVILPPYRQEFYDAMLESGNFTYIPKVYTELEALFERYEVIFFDYTDPTSIAGTDEELYDSWHSGELLSLRMILAIARHNPELLGKYTDSATLEAIIANTSNPFDVFNKF